MTFKDHIEKIFITLQPHKRQCLWAGVHNYCEKEFEITEDDIEFLKMLEVPPPNFCPTCRRIRRLGHMNTVRLFSRQCQAPEHKETIISIFPKECPFVVYDYQYFASPEFDPMNFGRVYDTNRSSFEQLFDLRKIFPMPSFLNRDPSSINSEYSNGGRDLKNGYFVTGCFGSEDVWYSNLINKSKEVMDSRAIIKSELVYGSFASENLYRTCFVYFSSDCSDSMFLFDCKNCTFCFNCINLRNKKYCVNNEQLTKEEYELFIKKIYPLPQEKIKEFKKEFWSMVKKTPIQASRNIGSKNVFGVLLNGCEDLYDVADAHNSMHIRHADGCFSHKDSMDMLFSGGNCHHLYQTINVGSSSGNIKFSVSSKFVTDCEFIFNCKNINNCFMCFGLENKSYCVLNTQYSKEKYFELVDTIKVSMLERGEYGDGFDLSFSAQAYNVSHANIAFPLTKEQIETIGGYTVGEPETNIKEIEVIKNVPRNIEEVSNEITKGALVCETTEKPFRIIQTELEFYRKMKLPLPTQHPSVRMESHYKLAPEGKMYHTPCSNCQKEMNSLFNPSEGYVLYCDDCFKAEFI